MRLGRLLSLLRRPASHSTPAALNPEDERLRAKLKRQLCIAPQNLALYQQALRHRSAAHAQGDNERLEFLGDAVLDAVVAEYIFKHYPTYNEGAMTRMRSHLVGRTAMNELALTLGLDKLLVTSNLKGDCAAHLNIYGNALEAMVGAIYLDQGFEATKEFVLEVLIKRCKGRKNINDSTLDYKSQLLQYCQKHHLEARFETELEGQSQPYRFQSTLWVQQEQRGTGHGASKKEAEQQASQQAWLQLKSSTPAAV